jgi:DNA invertase Pin-like site-specific DNA recombinase
MAAGRFVSYYRVSTVRQGQSGLGLEAQRRAVLDFLNGGDWQLVAEFTEVESGKDNDRPQLLKALAECRLRNATLVIAKLDRLSRNAAFLMSLQDASVEFVCADMPDANKMTVGIMAIIAQHEREQISARTKAALAARKARGLPLGNPANLTAEAQAKGSAAGAAVKTAKANARAVDLAPVIADIVARGNTSTPAIARELNARGFAAPRGGEWQPAQVFRVQKRLGEGASPPSSKARRTGPRPPG